MFFFCSDVFTMEAAAQVALSVTGVVARDIRTLAIARSALGVGDRPARRRATGLNGRRKGACQ